MRRYEVQFVKASVDYPDHLKPVRFDLLGPNDIKANVPKMGNIVRANGKSVPFGFTPVSVRKYKDGWKTLTLRNHNRRRKRKKVFEFKPAHTMTVRIKEL